MTAAGATTYQWDGANRLKSVNGGTSGSYGFDGNGKRVKKIEGGASTYYVYSSVIGSAVMEVASAGVQRAYVMGSGNVIAQRNADGQFYWLHADHLGSGRKMTDTSGNLTYRAEFDPYGKLLYEWSLGNQANRNSKKFTGYERDAGSGLDYAQARMYSSEWGRFMSPDPLSIGSANKRSPKSFNRYSYVEGDPVNKTDPWGLDSSGPGCPPTAFICTYASIPRDEIKISLMFNGYVPTFIDGILANLMIEINIGLNLLFQQMDRANKIKERRKAGHELAKRALEQKDCNDYLSAQGISADGLLEKLMEKGEFNEGAADYFKEHPTVLAGTQGVGENAKVFINPGFNDATGSRTATYDKTQFSGFGLGFPLYELTGIAFIFLHEIGHATGRWNDNDDKTLPGEYKDRDSYNNDIWEKCFSHLE